MNRRNILIALGAVASGGATIGTGAFSSTQANRSVSVQVESDNPGAYLAIDETNDSGQEPDNRGKFTNLPNGAAANLQGSALEIEIEGLGNGDGPATNAITDVDGVFELSNQGTQELFVNISSIDFSGGAGSGGATLSFYPGEANVTTDLSDDNAELQLPAGETAPIGVRIDSDPGTTTIDADKDTTITAVNSSDDPLTVQNNSGGPGTDGTGDEYNVPET